MRACWALDCQSPTTEIVDCLGRVTGCASLDVFEVAPLADTPGYLVVPVLSEDVSRIIYVIC